MTPRPTRPRAAALVVFGLALAARLIFVARQGPPLIAGDALEYQTYASSLLEKGRFEGFDGDRATRMPGYPAFLAAAESVLGSPSAVPWLQALLGAATCVLLLGLAETLLPAPWPLFCGLAAALSYDMLAPAGALLSESLYSFLLVLALWALLRERWTPSWRALVFGAASGAVYLVRPEPLPALALTGAALPFLFPRFRLADAGRALGALALVGALWAGRNLAVLHRLVPASTSGGFVSYVALYLPAHELGFAPEPRHEPPAGLSELERDADFRSAARSLEARLPLGQRLRARAFDVFSVLYPFLPGYDWSYVFLALLALGGLWVSVGSPGTELEFAL